ncbi:MAG: hypothetical protein HY360_25735, partial [Verrucomicrobia bacterium]|nr:hypothetical protein [Verrucomicrobiota bacterium]
MPPWFNIFATGFGCAFATLGLCALVALCLLPNAAAADRKYGNLIYPARGNIELDEGTAEIWLISGFDSEPEKKDAASACSAFNLIFPSNNAKYVLNFITWGKSFAQVGYGPLQHSYVWTRPLVWKPGEFHHLAWTWSGRKRSVYQHPTMVTTQVHGSAVQRFNGWKSMKIE